VKKMANGSKEVDDMQNQILKGLERKTVEQEKRLNELEVKFADLMGRMDLILKGMKWLGGLLALGFGIDAHGFMEA
tara:strand:+ start:1274 stop:1501 length:228 start_codon:yes stop_codon:yes gene_type:complete